MRARSDVSTHILSSPRKRGPIFQRRWLWVPAYAGTTATRLRVLLNERIAVEFVDRRRLLDEALRHVELLQFGEPLGVDLAQLLLSRVDQLGVHVEREADRAFLALPLRYEAHEVVRRLVGIVHDVLHAAQRRVHELAHHLRLVLDDLIGRRDALRHVREVFVGRDHLDLHARRLHRRYPIRHARHPRGFSGGDEFPHAGGTGRLHVHVVLRQARAREQPEQRIERRVLKRHHRDGLALEVGRLLDAGILAHDQLHETLAAEHGDDLHRHAVAADHDRPVRDDAAERRVTGADLLGHVDAAATNRKAHVEAGGGEIALALGKLDRPEGRQNRRRREQIRDLFQGLRRRRRAQQPQTERAAAGEEPAAGYFGLTCGHLTLSSRRIRATRRPHRRSLSATIRHGIVLQYDGTGKTRLRWSSFRQCRTWYGSNTAT